MKIALVDDDYTVRSLIKEFLEDKGHNVIAIDNPEKLENIKNFNMIIMDVVIGKERIGGIKYIIEQYRNRGISNNTHIVFISCFGKEASQIKNALQEVSDYEWLDKPIDFTELSRILENSSYAAM